MIGLACLIAALLLFVEHWFPWQLVIGRELPRPAAYILGVLAMVLPLSGLFIYWLSTPPELPLAYLIALWAVVASGGLAVLGAYALDGLLRLRIRAREQAELLDLIHVKAVDE